ncbi:hypothetical protein CEUSTIGMA_g7728.t1 [Chlamydomonas eustigma]|uniref:DNA mismatch repair proteins mutS family domain-containing protein n=1 Tax=Chlamydomonas eustigma TaxID=1157962 RepID=A0A250XC03_9CHLO|nr:hypothetical protein CEUSTIGMA_g7728.t1 [Chlamydomonas eustigma]|eukprot:GAX80290.1 hypothetical protein CEUSTIGMA_g7728.t1 [Chlamydomonas eustigma]
MLEVDREYDTSRQALNSTYCYASLIENVKREVGLAVFDPNKLEVRLVQFIEQGRGYSSTRLLLNSNDAAEVILVDSADNHFAFSASGVASSVPQGMPIHRLPRRCFDDTGGLKALLSCATDESEALLSHCQVHASHYLALGAAGALLQHLGSMEGGCKVLASKSVRVVLAGTTRHMQLDAGTVASLELVSPSGIAYVRSNHVGGCGGGGPLWMNYHQPAPASRSGHFTQTGPGASSTGRRTLQKNDCLLHMLDFTRTTCGSRLMRASLLQPLTDIPTLEMRYDCLEELLADQEMAADLSQALTKLPKDLDRMCCSLVLRQPKSNRTDPGQRIASAVSAVILLRNVLNMLPAFSQILHQAQSPLLKAVKATCEISGFSSMCKRIEEVLDSDAHVSKSPFMNRIQQCFAVHPGADPLLALARESFCRTTEHIHELCDHYTQRFVSNLNVKVSYSTKRGFYLIVSRSNNTDLAAGSSRTECSLPSCFTVLERRGGKGVSWCTTNELSALNMRLKDAERSCLALAEQVLDSLIGELSQHMSLLLRLVDNMALTDVMVAFSEASCSAPLPYCRPKLTRDGKVAILQGRHPVLERDYNAGGCNNKPQVAKLNTGRFSSDGFLGSDDPPGVVVYQANDTFLSQHCSFHIITGPTMSGKSTYLKQVAVLIILAQSGCFVPAQQMSLCPIHHIFSRMGTEDSIETKSSSFMVEMQEMTHILQQATPGCLVLIDELGRATSTRDGISLSWAIAEYLVDKGCATLMATHYQQLTELSRVYPCSVRHFKMQVNVRKDSMLDFLRKLEPTINSGRLQQIPGSVGSGCSADISQGGGGCSGKADDDSDDHGNINPSAHHRTITTRAGVNAPIVSHCPRSEDGGDTVLDDGLLESIGGLPVVAERRVIVPLLPQHPSSRQTMMTLLPLPIQHHHDEASSALQHYGITAACSLGLPSSLTDKAMRIASHLEERERSGLPLVPCESQLLVQQNKQHNVLENGESRESPSAAAAAEEGKCSDADKGRLCRSLAATSASVMAGSQISSKEQGVLRPCAAELLSSLSMTQISSWSAVRSVAGRLRALQQTTGCCISEGGAATAGLSSGRVVATEDDNSSGLLCPNDNSTSYYQHNCAVLHSDDLVPAQPQPCLRSYLLELQSDAAAALVLPVSSKTPITPTT